MSPNYINLPDYIKRRVDFLLQEAAKKSPRDQIITYCMRVLSNYASLGKDVGSYRAKMINRKVSKSAEYQLGKCTSLKEWADLCINEHEVPLKEIWSWLCNNAVSLNSDMVWQKFFSHPMVTITKDEDKKLNDNGTRSMSVEGRYEMVGIEISMLDSGICQQSCPLF